AHGGAQTRPPGGALTGRPAGGPPPARGKGLIPLLPPPRRYALVRPAAIGHIRRHAQANRLLRRLGGGERWRRPTGARYARGVAADAHSRRLRRVRAAAAKRARGAGDVRPTRHFPSSPRP